jgi:hypothetical protein
MLPLVFLSARLDRWTDDNPTRAQRRYGYTTMGSLRTVLELYNI